MSDKTVAVCALCENVRELRQSHFLPAAMFKHMQHPGDRSHAILDRENLGINNPFTSKQVKTYLLCDECEGRFSKNGEQWVMANGFHTSGMFPLQAALKAANYLAETDDGWAFSGGSIPGVEMEPLAYFAASVFWRATAHGWGCAAHRLDFGSRYQNMFQQYLLGKAAFPKDAALLIDVSDATSLLEVAAFPFGGKVDGTYYRYEFHIPGLKFTLFLGQRMLEGARRLCAVHTSEQWIFLSRDTRRLTLASEMMADRVKALNRR
jgi:uncharacterized protein YlaI